MSTDRIVIVGAGHAGGNAAFAIRKAGFSGSLTLVGAESHVPYERPPLSKEILLGQKPIESAYLRPRDWYAENAVDLRLGEEVLSIDRTAKVLRLQGGADLPYDRLLVATGARARRLPNVPTTDNLFYLRDIADVLALRNVLRPDLKLAVIGAGFIGLEVAAAARQLGCDVTVFEQAPRALIRSVPEDVSNFVEALHRSNGVKLHFGVKIELEVKDRVVAIHTGDGRRHGVDAVLAGLGAIPNVELGLEAGLETSNGIVVDEYGRTSDPDIFAAGDVTWHHNPLLGRGLRLESWQNAQNQAIAVAANVAGANIPFAELPWLWSDQFDMNLQIAGVPLGWERVVRRQGKTESSFTFFQVAGDQVVGVIGVNAARDMRAAKMMVGRTLGLDLEALADPARPLSDFAGKA